MMQKGGSLLTALEKKKTGPGMWLLVFLTDYDMAFFWIWCRLVLVCTLKTMTGSRENRPANDGIYSARLLARLNGDCACLFR